MAVALGLAVASAAAAEKSVTLAAAASLEDSGLLQYMLPIFEKHSGIAVRVAAHGAVGALDLARQGEADVVLSHDEDAERAFIAEGHGIARHLVMYNDFVLVGPKSDPAQLAGGRDIVAALQRIKARGAGFVSFGDNSDMYAAEARYWRAAGIDIGAAAGEWYRHAGPDAASLLAAAAAMGAHAIVDRGTWLSSPGRTDLTILVQRDPSLFNQYRVMLVNPQKHPRVKAQEGGQFIDWLVSKQGQHAIASYRVKRQILYFPNAKPVE